MQLKDSDVEVGRCFMPMKKTEMDYIALILMILLMISLFDKLALMLMIIPLITNLV